MVSSRQYQQQSCTTSVYERGDAAPEPRRLGLHGLLSAASIRALGRHPERAGEALLRARCAHARGVRRVELVRTCTPPDGIPPAGLREMALDCATGAISRSDF
jgi:hypothetical protein